MTSWCLTSLMIALLGADVSNAAGRTTVLEPKLVHLRSGSVREWSEFPEMAQGTHWEVPFSAALNDREFALRVRQQDVKQGWRVLLNKKPLGELLRDENDMVLYFVIPTGGLAEGENVLRIEPISPSDKTSDDIRVGQIWIEPRSVRDVTHAGTIEITVKDGEQAQLLPCRLTIVDAEGAMMTVGAASTDELAVRPGTVYAARGTASFGVPAGRYMIFAGRGFEYSLARTEVTIAAGETARRTLSIRREVPTNGYVACDTHCHTLTHSGHGDATITERLITLAGEGIELPIATDHNVHVDYEPLAKRLKLRQHFTPVMGNEVTTSVGHFNVFPVLPDARVPDHKRTDWGAIIDDIFQTPGVRVAILNHARDLHSGVRPFGPKLHNALVGENLNGWPMRFNAMEVVNSGAVQTDVLQLFHDWMGLLNRGLAVTPVSSSDSHDVARHFVGQARTYIRCEDHDPGQLDVNAAVSNFLQGRVLVSYGLLTELKVHGGSSGDLVSLPAATDDEATVPVQLCVLGPHWTMANRVRLYSNGLLIREEMLPATRDERLPLGVLWQDTWKIPRPRHDVHLVVIALGPGIDSLFWKTAKPYQPTSPDWHSQVLGCSGAVWLDGDNDGRRTTARGYAEQSIKTAGSDHMKLMAALRQYDEATASQAAHLLVASGESLQSQELQAALKSASRAVQSGFQKYLVARRENDIARVNP